MIEPHKFEYCEVAHCDCGLCAKCSQTINDPIHQQESQQCGSCAGNLPNHEEGCFYKLAQESLPATHPAEAPEGLRAVEAFYKGQIAQAKQDNEQLRAVISTPEVYAGVVSEECEQYWGQLLKQAQTRIAALERDLDNMTDKSVCMTEQKEANDNL